jgi:branched-chain amino acid aminotransferase
VSTPLLPILSLNGHHIQANTPSISPFDRGFTLGDGLFETLKVTYGVPWYLTRHLGRLSEGATRLGMTVPPHLQQWIDDIVQHATREGHTEHALRVTVTRGVASTHGLAGQGTQHPTVVITAFEMPHVPSTVYERGVSLGIASTRRYESAAAAGLKTTSYIEPILALREAHTAGYDDALFLDTRGFVAEASASNIFVWHRQQLMTPSYACGILPGITRAVVLELAKEMALPTVEGEITQADLIQGDEIFLTSSLRGIVPVVQVNQIPVGAGVPGSVTSRIMARYTAATLRL